MSIRAAQRVAKEHPTMLCCTGWCLKLSRSVATSVEGPSVITILTYSVCCTICVSRTAIIADVRHAPLYGKC